MGEDVEKLKQHLPLLDYLRQRNWTSQPAGRSSEFVGLCPLHAETRPSFYVNARKNLFYCHGCGRGGDLIRFVQLSRHLSFRQSLAYLEQQTCGSPKLDRPDHIDFSTAWKEQSGNMLAILLGLFRLVWLFGRGHHAVALENLALRQQLALYKRKKKRPRLVGRDRWFWIALSAMWKDWRRPLFVVHPDTVVRWQRERFCRYWAQRSKKSGRRGRPPISRQVRELIRTIACANPLWRAPRIHGELRKLGIDRNGPFPGSCGP